MYEFSPSVRQMLEYQMFIAIIALAYPSKKVALNESLRRIKVPQEFPVVKKTSGKNRRVQRFC